MCIRSRTSCGFTLIELMVVVAITAILLVIAGPSMRQLTHSTRIQSEMSRLMTAIVFVRSEAIKRNMPVSMCPSAMAASGLPTCVGTYAGGWIVFSNHDRDRVVDPGDELIRIFEGLPSGYTLTNRKGTRNAKDIITYLPNGTSGRNRTLLVCSPPRVAPRLQRSVVMNIVGRPRFARHWGTCPSV